MAAKTVTISARIPREDAEFISQLQVNGATTPSDKLRAIINEARQRQLGKQDYRGCMTMVQDMVAPVSTHTREQEHIRHVHSELVTRVLDWLPDTMAFMVASVNSQDNESDADGLNELEDGIADRVFRLMESVLQMGVTQRCPCYNRQAIQERVGPILDLMRVIEMAHQPVEEKKG
jgi:hypothetical protein